MSRVDVVKVGGGGPRDSWGRCSSKWQAILWPLQNEHLDALSRELQVNVGTLSARRDSALNASLTTLKSRPGFVRAPEGNGVAERSIRTLKGQLLRIEPFKAVEDPGPALQQWRKQYNTQSLVQRRGHRIPERSRQVLVDLRIAA